MRLHQENHFETEIGEHLAANGWLCEAGDGTKCGSAVLAFSEVLNCAEGGKNHVIVPGVVGGRQDRLCVSKWRFAEHNGVYV